MKVAIASDHRGYELKRIIIDNLKDKYQILDLGTNNIESVDYPLYGIKLGETVKNKEADLGIAICGTGIGISIAANKVKGIICAKISNEEEARLAKEHNHANIIALSGNQNPQEAVNMINTFIECRPSEDERHQRRIRQIQNYENAN